MVSIGVMTMADDRERQDELQDEVTATEERSEELSDEQLDTIAGGAVNAFVSFYDKADGESIQK
jgi:hypothetical protein